MKVGTKSVLFGAHAFWLHPWFVSLAWTKLYGFPCDPRLWFAFFLHDIGYLGKPNMDGPEGESHPEVGARIMGWLFDGWEYSFGVPPETCQIGICHLRQGAVAYYRIRSVRWHDFCLFHSRYYAKARGAQVSRLCVADKLATALTPRWLYLPMVNATGEIHEYLRQADTARSGGRFRKADYIGQQKLWHAELCRYMREWVEAHKDGTADTWTSTDRHAHTDSGVTQ